MDVIWPGPPAWPKVRYFLGLDLGQTVDPSAISVVERRTEPVDKSTIRPDPETVTTYNVRHLERLPLRTPYPAIVTTVAQMMNTAPLRGNVRLVVDQTGVGRPVVDLLRAAKLKPIAVTITAGDSFTQHGREFRVSKLQLVSQLQALFHSGELRIAEELAEAHVLKTELADFRANVTASGATTFGARAGRHDDLVLSVAIASWYARQAHRNRIISTELRL